MWILLPLPCAGLLWLPFDRSLRGLHGAAGAGVNVVLAAVVQVVLPSARRKPTAVTA